MIPVLPPEARPTVHIGRRRVVLVGEYRAPLAPGLASIDLHRNPAVQIVVATAGRLAVTDGETTYTGRAVVIPWGTRRAVRPSTSYCRAVVIYLHPTTPEAQALMAASDPSDGPRSWLQLGQPVVGTPIPATISAATAADLVLEVLLRHRRVRSDAVSITVDAAIDALAQRLPRKVYLAELADAVAVSESTLGRLLVKEASTTWPALVRGTRLFRALAEVVGGRNLTEAAHAAGFTDSTHLTKVCREMTGIPPSVFVRALPGLCEHIS